MTIDVDPDFDYLDSPAVSDDVPPSPPSNSSPTSQNDPHLLSSPAQHSFSQNDPPDAPLNPPLSPIAQPTLLDPQNPLTSTQPVSPDPVLSGPSSPGSSSPTTPPLLHYPAALLGLLHPYLLRPLLSRPHPFPLGHCHLGPLIQPLIPILLGAVYVLRLHQFCCAILSLIPLQ